jgi:hypothetical protein
MIIDVDLAGPDVDPHVVTPEAQADRVRETKMKKRAL